MEACGDLVPEPSSLEALIGHPDNANGIAIRVTPGESETRFHATSNDLWPEPNA